MSLHLLGLGSAFPEHAIDQARAAEIVQEWLPLDPAQVRRLRALYRRSGVERRHSVLLESRDGAQSFFAPAAEVGARGPGTRARMEVYEREAGPLAARAARKALSEADLGGPEITHLVTVSCTGFYAPGVDSALIRALELPPNVARAHVGFMGCHGAFNGLRVADAFAATDPAARVLVCAVELPTLHFYYGWDGGKVVANALFADGAAAAVGRAPRAGDDGPTAVAFGSQLFPDSADDMTWTVGDHGFEMSLSARVPEHIGAHLRPWLEGWLRDRDCGLADVATWAIHPGGPRILDAAEETLELPAGATAVSRDVLANCGNMSSPTVLVILERLRRAGMKTPCVALGFGPGLIAEAMLLR